MEQEQEQRKHIISTTIVEVDYDRDLALAVSLQQEEGDFTMLETIESDDEEEEEDESDLSSSTDSDYANFFTSQELAEFELLLEVELDDNRVIEEDEIDPDELSYEDLVALGERVGEENQGLSPEEILSTLSPYICKYIQSNTGIDRCVICQVDYEEGEELVNLRCEHPFHQGCISQWLQIKKTCPICSKEVIKQKTE